MAESIPQDGEARAKRISLLLDLATESLCRAGKEFQKWASWMAREACGRRVPEPTPSELIWAWNALRSDGELSAAFGFLEGAPDWVRARAREQDGIRRVVVCPQGVIFEVRLRPETDLPEWKRVRQAMGFPEPRAFVRLDEPLAMRYGRLGRFNSSTTACMLITPAMEITDKHHAGAVFGVSPEVVTFHGESREALHVPCRSLNQAYILASQRFERRRRSRGGRIYENLILYYPPRKPTLEELQQAPKRRGICSRRVETLDDMRWWAERGKPKVIRENDVFYPIDIPWADGRCYRQGR